MAERVDHDRSTPDTSNGPLRQADTWDRSAVHALLTAALLIVVLRNAWLCDDSYVTFRTVDNLLHGHGLRWNVAERVQGFTHPLWALSIALVYAFSGEIFYTVIGVSVLLSGAVAFVLASRVAVSAGHAVLALLCLSLSRAFIDYSTSGLENPLTHLLLVALSWTFFAGPIDRARLQRLMGISGLLVLNRFDTLWFALPVLAYGTWTLRAHPASDLSDQADRARLSWRLWLRDALIAFSPLLLWLIFSLIYYGFPFPNTAYAKLSTGIASHERWHQGFLYGISTLSSDPTTMLCLIAGPLLALRRNTETRERVWLAGAFLYCVYVVRIGGDFMEGRFFAAPFLACVISLARARFDAGAPVVQLAGVGTLLLIGLNAQHPPPSSDASYRAGQPRVVPDVRGVADERGFYYLETGLINAQRGKEQPNHLWAEEGAADGARARKPVVRNTIGMYGFTAGPALRIVDRYALTDPLLARLPAKRNVDWRIGHFERVVPDGYLETLHKRKPRFRDQRLGRYYDALRTVISGPIWSWQRFVNIWQLNTGALDHLINRDHYRHPDLLKVGLATVSKSFRNGAAWDKDGTHIFGSSGIEIYLNGVQHNAQVEVSLDSSDRYEVVFMRGTWRVDGLETRATHFGGLSVHRLNVPADAVRHGYDRIRVYPLQGTKFSLGHLFLK